MTKLNTNFKKQIKDILLKNYKIACYQINDISNLTSSSMNFQLFCRVDEYKFLLYLRVTRPNTDEDSESVQQLSFNISSQGQWMKHIPDIQSKMYVEELVTSFEKTIEILQSLTYEVQLSARRGDSISLVNGICIFTNQQFEIDNMVSEVHVINEIYAYSPMVHTDLKLCDYIVNGNAIELSKRSSKMILSHHMTTGNTEEVLSDFILKFYIELLQNKFKALSDVSVSDIATSSSDDLKNILTLFKIERI